MAPEQHDGKATFKSDIFSLGATAYELLTGVLPFTAPDLKAQKLRERYAPLPETVPKGLRDAVAACLKADPAARPKDARAVEKLLSSGA